MTDFNHFTFGFVGLGLIGGSIARAIRQYWPSAIIRAFNPSRDALEEAMGDGVVNSGHCREDVPEGHAFNAAEFEDCDILFLCAPVQKNAENLAEIRDHLKPGSILTDIGSTKRDIHEHVRELGLTSCFIGGHPMTGSERTRYHNSKASILENAYYIVAPEKDVPKEKSEMFREFVESIHALPLMVDCDFHDYAVGGISHVPHVVSAALVNLVRKSDSPEAVMKTIAAGGFKDITRISSSSPVMWQQICMTNGDNIVSLLDDYISGLKTIRDEIAEKKSSQIYEFFDSARQYRDSFTDTDSGALNRSFVLHVDIEDHAGMLAEVVTILGVNGINIKNISITHNREYQEGALRIEFYSAGALKDAQEILTIRSYNVH